MTPTPFPRRRFIGIAAAGAVALPWWVKGAGGAAWTAAVIGHTGRGDYGHGLDEIFQGRPEVARLVVADADTGGLERASKRLKAAAAYRDYREMLERERPQLVSVATRHADQHLSMVLAAVRGGAHVFCEKPFVRSCAEADQLLAEADRTGRKVVVSHQMRMAPAVVELKKEWDAGGFGELLEMRGYGKQDSRAGGEDMMVLGTHVFDLMRLFAGDPLSCTARVTWQGRDVVRRDARQVKDDVGWVAGDEVSAQFHFSRRVHATFTSRARQRESTGAWGLELIGTSGAARINANLPPSVFRRNAGRWTTAGRTEEWVPFQRGEEKAGADKDAVQMANARLVEDWLTAIRANREPVCNGRNGAWAVEMVMGVYHAALTARAVTFPLSDRQHPLR